MILRKDLLSLNFYKKEHFSGSDREKSLRYRIERVQEDEDAEPCFCATIWPEPYSFENTDEDKKSTKSAPFSEEGLQELVDWMNSQSFAEG